VDKEDAMLVQRFKWHLHPKGYVITGINNHALTGRHGQVTTAMHRLVMDCKVGDGQTVNHINYDPLDNRKANLRIVEPGVSLRNRRVKPTKHAYKGVRKAGSGNYLALIHLGGFEDPEDAARAYDDAIRKLFPGHPVNFPQDGETSALHEDQICYQYQLG
jgi:hypothetical protein